MIERHVALMPKVKDTQVKSEVRISNVMNQVNQSKAHQHFGVHQIILGYQLSRQCQELSPTKIN